MDWKKLLGSITESVDEEIRLRNAYLGAENHILRQQISGRMRLSESDRRVLAEIGKKLGKKALEEIATVAKSNTILAWHRKFIDQKGDTSQPHKAVGRPRIDQEIEGLVVRMARENRSWGYDRIVGALANLGYTISDQTVGNILKRHGIPPGPGAQKDCHLVGVHPLPSRCAESHGLLHQCGVDMVWAGAKLGPVMYIFRQR
jgi:putative transposase